MADPNKGFTPDKFEVWREIAQAVGLTVREVSVKGYTWYEAVCHELMPPSNQVQGQFHPNKGGWVHFGLVMHRCGYEPNPYPHKEGKTK